MCKVIVRDKKGEVIKSRSFKDKSKADSYFVKNIIKIAGHLNDIAWGDIRANDNFFVHKDGCIQFLEKE